MTELTLASEFAEDYRGLRFADACQTADWAPITVLDQVFTDCDHLGSKT